MTNETKQTLIEFLALGAAFALFISLVHPWAILVTAVLAGAAAVIALFKD